MGQPHELQRVEMRQGSLESWRITPDMTDPQILEHLRAVERPFFKEITVNRAKGGVLLDAEVVLSFRVNDQGQPRLFVSRKSDVSLVSRLGEDITAKFTQPSKKDYSTGYLRVGGKLVSYIGDKYEIRFRGMNLGEIEERCDLTVLSTSDISDKIVPTSVRDYHLLLSYLDHNLNRLGLK